MSDSLKHGYEEDYEKNVTTRYIRALLSETMESSSDSEDDDNEDDDEVVDIKTSSHLDLIECLRLQHAELEMLESMFPEELKVFGSKEICGDD